jgi:filamentous hemagglutinin family protein
MTARARTLRRPPSPVARRRRFRLAPLARAVGIALAAGGLLGQAHAQKVFGPAWFAAKGAAPGQTATPGAQPGGALLPQPGVPDRQSQAAREKLQTSIANLSQAAQAIAARQSAQTAARTAAQTAASTVANGLAEGGLKVDTNSLTAGWTGAKGPTQSVADGRTTVRIEQTDSKAILNWETFNVGRQTTVQFAQQAGDAVLNRVNDPQARPSQIQGRIEAAGTVLIVNRNGIVFDGSSQVNTRNLAAAAVGMSDARFHKGLYSDAQGAGVNQRHIPSFANDLSTTASGFSHGAAEGQVIVNAGARLQTHAPATVTEGGGYVMLLGGQVHNAGEIVTPNGQAVLAAGDAFTIRKGMGTEQNATSTTRGNLVDTLRVADSAAGLVRNTGLVQAATGDITLTGHELRQAGVLQSSTSVHTRGTVHLKAVGADASVTLEGGSTTAIVLDASATTALDVQRETLVKDSDKAEKGARLDQSLVQIDSAGSVDFQQRSLTLATSGQVFVDAAGTATVHDQARIDVSGYVGVKIAMDANNVLVNVQGFEQRDAPVNRDGDKLRNNDIWLDRRDLVLVPAGTNGAEGDRWYTAGGLLEVGGYLGITGHGIGEWSAQGGTVQFSGKSLVTQQGSSINLSGGTLDVQTGQIWQTWLKGADGQLYNASSAPGDLLYTGLYRGFESVHKRWGNSATEAFRNPLIAPEKRVENGYTVGRDGGRLVVATTQAELQGDIETATYQGERQLGAREQGLDGYRQAQTAVARNGELVIGRYTPVYDADTRDLRHTPQPVAEQIAIGLGLATPAEPEDGQPPPPTRIALDAGWLNGLELGALRAYATGSVAVDAALTVAPGGEIALHATQVDIHADLTARGGRIALGNIAERHVSASQGWALQPVTGTAPPPVGYEAATTVADGVTLDTRGIWNNLQQDATAIAGLPYANGGSITVRSSGHLTIGKGALLDTSSGATLHADDRLAGGKGGDITLVADGYPLDGSAAGLLVLEGELRGHGAKGGGTLHLQTGDAVVIGGQTAGSDGTLQAGQAALVNLVTTEAFTIAAGAVLPVDYHFVRTRAAAGEVVGGVPQVTVTDPDSWIRLEASWTLPKPSSNTYYAVATADGRVLNVQGYDWSAPVTLAAGTVIRQINNPQGFPVNAVVPAGAVPGGIPIVPTAGVLQAGTVAATDTTYAAGSLIGAGGRLPQTVAVRAPLQLDAERFAQGFSRYEVAGGQGLALAEGADLRVAMPVLQADAQTARTISTGADPQSVLQPVLLPQFSEDPATGRLQQRAGADLVLTAGTARSVQQGTAAPLLVPDSARIEVDAGHRIGLHGNGQITVDGQLRAHGGHIELLGLGYSGTEAGNLQGHDGSYWIGERAVLDVSGIAHTALDGAGRRYGTVLDGGRIEIGGAYTPFATIADAIDNFIVVRPGARLDASGAAATLDLPGLGATALASDGGVIHLASFNGLFLDGNLRAAAGGAGAAGGTLSVVLETPNYSLAAGPSDRVRVHREIQLVAQQGAPQLAADLKPGEADPALAYGRALLGADRITAGGFDNLALLSNGMLTLGDGLDLRLGQSLYLAARSTSLLEGSEEGARVRLAAPHVRLSSPSRLARDNYLMPYLTAPAWDDPGMVSVLDDTQLRIDAGLLELQNRPTFGAYGKSQLLANPEQLERNGFELLELRSQGDLRFLAQDFSDRTQLTTEGDLVLAASQIYPATGARAEVIAGRLRTPNEWGTPQTVYDPTRSLRIERVGEGAAPPVPYSAFGSLALLSANIDQGGVLRAPLGQLQLGVGLASGINEQEPTQLVLRPGSITSVSAAGLVMPYGGTVDGLTYNYAGADVFFRGLGGLMGEVKLAADTVDVQGGAKLDLTGGGELRGAGFLTGRGGSTDARLNPLVQMTDGGFVLPGLATNPVYAIVPGVQQAAAPVAAENGAGDPAIGRQITIGAGVPGLPAGTYTLLPSTYALAPGAFRVELNGLASQGAAFGTSTAMRNGSHTTAVRLGTAGTAIADVQTTQAIVTSGETLRQYSQYNETSYAQFGLDWAVRDGLPRPQLERDARQLNIQVSESLALAQGVADFTPAKDGRGGTVVLNAGRIEVLADGAAPTAGFDGISVEAGMLNGLGAASIAIGGAPSSTFSSTAYQSSPTAWHVSLGGGATDEIILREGAVLRAAQVLLTVSNREMGLIVEQGASIDLLGRGKAPWDSNEGFVLVPGSTGVLALSNGWLDIMPSSADESFGTRGAGYLHIGTCATGAVCSGETRLYAEGTITAATNKSFLLDDSVRYGARNLVLAMAAINVGSNDALAQAGAAGIVPDGLTLNQGVLDRLLRGDTSTGAPALENLVLNARDAVNFYGSVNLSTIDAATGKSSLAQLALGAPAIYGHGAAGDVARIQTDTLVWNGALTPAGTVIAGGAGTGSGQLVIDARQIEFGYGPKTQPNNVATHDRLALGFDTVQLNASERITANHKGSLSVYQAQGDWNEATKAYDRSGGHLQISTPLLTGHAGSVNTITAGGSISARAPTGSTSPLADNAMLAGALGAELALHAGTTLTLDTAVLLPSGKLTLSAQGDVTLAANAQLDLAGRKIDFFDVSQYSWGGEALLKSQTGDVQQLVGSKIDLSAKNNRAGRLTATAMDGQVALAGAIAGSSTGSFDAGGTQVPYAAGFVDLRGQQIADFAGLNTRLTEGGVTGGRSFQITQGDLVIGNEVKAREINVSVDHGSLTVTGKVDASGAQAGSIRLAANGGLRLADGAVLDASATQLRKDSYGQVIEAPNRAVIELDSGDGRLVLGSAAMNLAVAGAPASYGTVTLNAPRLGANDVDIDARGNVTITGAKSIAVNAFRRYDDAAAGTDASVDGRSYQVIDQAYLDAKHADSTAFMAAALANGSLMDGKLAGLRGYTEQFHLRPGVEIVSNAATNPDGNLHVDGDLDLSGHRYASVNPRNARTSTYGSGEAGALVLRAQGDLVLFGSITDGFDTSVLPPTADDAGWVLPAGRMPFGGDLIVPHGGVATLDAGTRFAVGRTLNYDLPVSGLTLPAGTQLPTAMPLGQALDLPAGTVLGAAVRDAHGSVLHAAGSVLAEAVTLPAGTQLGAGFRLPQETQLAATLWPKGVALPVPMSLSAPLTLAKGAIVPSETDVVLPGGATLVNLRPLDADGNQGRNLAIAPMLAAGSQSWDMRLVAGADLAAADARLTRPGSTATLRLADTHFGMGALRESVYGFSADADPGFIDFMASMGIDVQPGQAFTPDFVQMLWDYGILWSGVTDLNEYGYGTVLAELSATISPAPARQQLYSVLRTGTGDLDLVSGGDFTMQSLYGIYTAGTASASLGAAYDLARGRLADGTVLQTEGSPYEHLVDGGAASLYHAWYPEQGGNVLLRAGGDIRGDLVGDNGGIRDINYTFANSRQQIGTASVGSWLWRQGTGSVAEGADAVPTAWWINFGSYVAPAQRDPYGSFLFGNDAHLVGFTGIGTLGGGNLQVQAGGDAGIIDPRGLMAVANGSGHTPRSQGLHLAVASTGRVTPAGEIVQTGGGDLELRLGGALNPEPALRLNTHDLNSTFVNLRGAMQLQAGAIGGVQLAYGAVGQMDSRPGNPFQAGRAAATGGPILVLGDAGVRIETRGDLVLGGVADPGRTLLPNSSPFSHDGQDYAGRGWTWFSLWTPATAIDLLTAGGHLTPTTVWEEGGGSENTRWQAEGRNQSANGDGYFYPSILRAAAANGSLFYGANASSAPQLGSGPVRYGFGVTLAPSPLGTQFTHATGQGELQLLAAGSIHASGFAITASTADPAGLSSVLRPGFVGVLADSGGGQYGFNPLVLHNAAAETTRDNDWIRSNYNGDTVNTGGRENTAPLFTFGTPATSDHAVPGRAPARYYAATGDIVGLRLGQELKAAGIAEPERPMRYEGSVPVAVRAGRDITDSGTRLGQQDTVAGRRHSLSDTRGNLIAHSFADDISVVEAGRDIRNSSFYIVGPGLLDISAGRDVYLGNNGEFKSLGPVVNVTPGDRSSGAGISVAAGMGPGARWEDFAKRYLDPANQADLELPFADQPGKALRVYSGTLTLAQWLQQQFGYAGDEAGAQDFLAAKQAELDAFRLAEVAAGRRAANRALAREYRQEDQLHLANWLTQRFGKANGLGLAFDAATMDARAFFTALPAEQQRVFLRNVYYNELRAAGREYTDADGKRSGSYLRGREAIATLFPEQDAEGRKIAYGGDLTMFSSALYYNADIVSNPTPTPRPRVGAKYMTQEEWIAAGRPMYNASYYAVIDAGIHTNFGGDISIMTPGGRTLVGIDGGFNPGPGSGVMTQGEGDISIYAAGDILMGQSRIFTTFGGNILGWSAAGDINAGRGSKTTVVYTPARRVYDDMGNVALSPSAPTTGAGIATLNPIAEIPPGDIDLIAPLGTIDAGEAGIRVSGNVNLAAMQVLNAENIDVQGEAVGIPVVAAVNVAALTNASAAASQASVAAQEVVQRERAAARQALPSVFQVRVIGFGDQPAGGAAAPSGRAVPGAVSYDRSSPLQLVAVGASVDAGQARHLTAAQRAQLQRGE